MSASTVFALVDGRKNTTSASCTVSRPSWAQVYRSGMQQPNAGSTNPFHLYNFQEYYCPHNKFMKDRTQHILLYSVKCLWGSIFTNVLLQDRTEDLKPCLKGIHTTQVIVAAYMVECTVCSYSTYVFGIKAAVGETPPCRHKTGNPHYLYTVSVTETGTWNHHKQHKMATSHAK